MYESQKLSSSNKEYTLEISLKVFPKKSYKFKLTISTSLLLKKFCQAFIPTGHLYSTQVQ